MVQLILRRTFPIPTDYRLQKIEYQRPAEFPGTFQKVIGRKNTQVMTVEDQQTFVSGTSMVRSHAPLPVQ